MRMVAGRSDGGVWRMDLEQDTRERNVDPCVSAPMNVCGQVGKGRPRMLLVDNAWQAHGFDLTGFGSFARLCGSRFGEVGVS